MIYGVTCFAVIFSFVGTMLGGIWADQSWGRFWGWDPKENGALLIVIWSAIVLHARWGGIAKDRGIAALAIGGNIVTAWSWFGTNLLQEGLHSYGFSDSGFLWLMRFIGLQLLFIAIAYIPKRLWRSELGRTSALLAKQTGGKEAGVAENSPHIAKESNIKHTNDEDSTTAPRTSRMAIASFLLALAGSRGPSIFMQSVDSFLFGQGGLWNIVLIPLPIYLGHRARSKIRRSEGKLTGSGIALAALIIGYLTLLIFLIIMLSKI
jgi:hypothetical protein